MSRRGLCTFAAAIVLALTGLAPSARADGKHVEIKECSA